MRNASDSEHTWSGVIYKVARETLREPGGMQVTSQKTGQLIVFLPGGNFKESLDMPLTSMHADWLTDPCMIRAMPKGRRPLC